jgi:BirA family transcriptional regulator, biotin operon repressor / biotin---[acetyl-CoA-carboxylase] ligase
MNTTISRALGDALILAATPFEVQWHESVGSTNDLGLQLAFSGEAAAPVLIGANHQMAGRGRRGRGWVSERPTDQVLHSITMSLVFERQGQPQASLAGYSLVVGWAMVQALVADPGAQAAPGTFKVKWPNDVQLDGRKCAGILIETRRCGAIERVVVGMGLNLWIAADRETGVNQPMASVLRHPPDAGIRNAMIVRLAREQYRAWAKFCRLGFAGFQAQWAEVDALLGKQVQVLGDPLNPLSVLQQGRACGVALDGALLLQGPQGIESVYAGEVSVRALA